jgi:uncharacterized protein DUF6702
MLTALLLATWLGARHPIHSSSASLTPAPDGRSASIVLRVFADDFPPGTSRTAIEQYLANRFRVYDAAGRTLLLQLDGALREGSVTTIRLTVSAPSGLRGARVWHGVLGERFPDQVNILQIQRAGRTHSLLFTASDGPKPLP